MVRTNSHPVDPEAENRLADQLAERNEAVIVPATVAGLATATILYRALGDPAILAADPFELPALLDVVAADAPVLHRLTIAGLALDSAELTAAAESLGAIRDRAAVDWYDNHYWPPDAQAAIWPICRRGELGPDVANPLLLIGAELPPGTPLVRRLHDLVENGTDSGDPWVRHRYRFFTAILQPARENLIPDAVAWTNAESNALSEVEQEYLAEQTATEKAVERVVREELETDKTDRGTNLLLADLGEWSRSPYLFYACRRFFKFDVLLRVLPEGRVAVERSPEFSIDFGRIAQIPGVVPPGGRVRVTRDQIVLAVEPDQVEEAVNALIAML